MASSSVTAAVVIVACVLLLSISPSKSQTCSSQTLQTKFESCVDLPTLKSSLHYTYNATNSSLSVAFVAPPAKPEGWIAWAINPTGKGMAGAQALLAFKSNNRVIVKTYDVVSYSNIAESKLSFDAWDLSGEAIGDGNMVIYGSLRVPDNVDKLNQVWQVGAEVSDDGKPRMHEFQPDNLKAMAILDLHKSNSTSPTPAPSSSLSPAQAPAAEGGSSSLEINPLSSLAFLFFAVLFLC